MKYLLPLFALLIYNAAFTQETIFQDNLFNDPSNSVLVQKTGNYYTLKFDESPAMNIYSWDFKTVYKAFKDKFLSDEKKHDEGSVAQEAGRVFYAAVKNERMMVQNTTGPSAGTFGFENKKVSIQRSERDYKIIYKSEVKAARKYFYWNRKIIRNLRRYLKTNSRNDSITSELEQKIHYNYFMLDTGRHGRKIFDTRIEKGRSYCACRLKRKGRQLFYRDLNLKIDSLRSYYFDPELNAYEVLKMEEDQLNKLSRNMSILEIKDSDQKLNVKQDSLLILEQNINGLKKQLGLDRGHLDKKISLDDRLKQKQDKLRELSKYQIELNSFEIDSIEVEVSKTFIENFAVYGKVKFYDFHKNGISEQESLPMTFYNHLPLGISTLASIENAVSRIKLYGGINGKMYEMSLGDVMAFYRPDVKNYRTDLSPADTSFTLVKNKGMQEVHTYKTATKRLFEMRVYSDFVGMSGTAPNGLVQTELSKEVYTNSRKTVAEGRHGLFVNWCFGTYITPYTVLSKLEQNNKYLPLFRYSDPALPASLLYAGNSLYATTVQLKRYENFSAGMDLNLVSLTIPKWKTQYFLDPGIAYGRTGVGDSILGADSIRTVHEFGVNTISVKITLKVVFQTDERYFFDMRAGFQWLNILSGEVSQTQRFRTQDLRTAPRLDQKMLFTMGLNAGFSPTSNINGRLFFRYNYYGLVTRHAKEGFSQVQLGYSYYLKN